MSRKPGPGELDPEGRALWNRVARSVDRLPGRHILADPEPQARFAMRPAPRPRASAAPSPAPAPAPAGQRQRAADTLDGSWDKRMARGRIDPDATIDLHGLTLDQAWRRLDFALEEAIAIGTRVLLVITGKAPRDPSAGRVSADRDRARGMIRATLDDWIGASRHRAAIAAVRGAHPRHGGTGAVYVVLRRRRG